MAAAAVEAAEAAYDQDEVVPMSEATPSSTRVVRVAKNRAARAKPCSLSYLRTAV